MLKSQENRADDRKRIQMRKIMYKRRKTKTQMRIHIKALIVLVSIIIFFLGTKKDIHRVGFTLKEGYSWGQHLKVIWTVVNVLIFSRCEGGIIYIHTQCNNSINPLTALSKIVSKNYSWSHLCLAFIEIICYGDIIGDVVMGVHVQNFKAPDWLIILTKMRHMTLYNEWPRLVQLRSHDLFSSCLQVSSVVPSSGRIF